MNLDELLNDFHCDFKPESHLSNVCDYCGAGRWSLRHSLKQSIGEAIERAKPKQVIPPTNGLDPEGYDMGRKQAIEEYSANLLHELGLEPEQEVNDRC